MPKLDKETADFIDDILLKSHILKSIKVDRSMLENFFETCFQAWIHVNIVAIEIFLVIWLISFFI